MTVETHTLPHYQIHPFQPRPDGQGGCYGVRQSEGGPAVRINFATIDQEGPYTADPLHGHHTGVQNFLVQQGILQIEIEGEVIEVVPGVLCEIQPNTLYRMVGVKSAPCTYLVICNVNNATDRFELD